MAYTDEYGTTFSDDRKRLIKFNSSWNDYSIPEGTEEIAANAFNGNQTIKTLYLPTSIKLIEKGAFEKCKIEEIHFAGGLEKWLLITWRSIFSQGYKLFFNDNQLVESIIIPNSISVIKSLAFYYCKSLQSVIFNKRITSIESDAFNKTGLKGILSIPLSCEKIGEHAFFNCTGITKVKIPEATKEIGFGAFCACYALKEFKVDGYNSCFFSDGIGLYSVKRTPKNTAKTLELIALASGNHEKYIMHELATSIEKDACCFSSIPSNGLEIHNSLSIADDAFRESKGIIHAPIRYRQLYRLVGVPEDNYRPIFVYKDALISQDCPKVISENPFRVLGVYSNASQREIQSNAARIKRFLEIGKQPSFSTDFNCVLPSLERTPQMVDKALSQISQPKEKLAYALLWFTKPCCEQHKRAENLFLEGKVNEASNLLKNRCGDIRINLAPYICLENQDVVSEVNILDYVTVFYSYFAGKEMLDENEKPIKFDESLLDQICGDNFSISEDECQVLFLEMLMTFLKPVHLWACANTYHLSDSVIEHLFNKSIAQNISHINSQISLIKSIDKKESAEILKSAKDLKQKTSQDIIVIDHYMPSKDVRFISIHDSLANQILQSAIDAYNYANNRTSVSREVYSLMSYAKNLAKGELLKNRCEDNLKIVKKIMDELPPEGLEDTEKALLAIVNRARNSADTVDQAINLLKETEPYLFTIKQRQLGERNSNKKATISTYFTRISTVIANVCLNKLIEEVNSSRSNKNNEAWRIITALNQLPLDAEFKKSRYDENVAILINNMASEMFGRRRSKDEISYGLIDLRTEDALWEDCKKDNNFKQYIKRFPNGAYINEAHKLQNAIDKRNAELKRIREERLEEVRKSKAEKEERQRKIDNYNLRLNWIIGILVVLIIFQLIYSYGGWDALVIPILVAFIFGIWIFIGWVKDNMP